MASEMGDPPKIDLIVETRIVQVSARDQPVVFRQAVGISMNQGQLLQTSDLSR